MSIPPLVCSTPPPPDQCDDDKEHEDYDIQYNLSQEDDENYDYGNFSSYNHFQSSKSESNKPAVPTSDRIMENEEKEDEIRTENRIKATVVENKEEDLNIEDLNLIIDQETLERTNIADDKLSQIETETNIQADSSDKEINIPDKIIHDHLDTLPLPNSDFSIASTSIDQIDEPPTYINEIIVDSDSLQGDNSESDNVIPECIEIVKTDQEISIKESLECLHAPTEDNAEDEFEDFDNFQSVVTNELKTIVDNSDNPWDSKEADGNSFGDFTANFDQVESKTDQSEPAIEQLEHELESKCQIETNEPEDDDDFGEFDDFQSSGVEAKATDNIDELFSQGHMLDLRTENESQLMDNINEILSSIFESEIPQPETEFDGKLESVLGVTWGHLLETDVRQPYMVNWNNSLGQETLLTALCIDSRNILFGPKWSSNMPKYAANLSTAPLQPQKQSAGPSTSHSESLSSGDKAPSKPTNWSDPFTSDGQESCSTEGNETTPIEIGPTDLDAFEAALSLKPSTSKIISSTLNVQPLRQINLPDTHIFTPTDSETPRSKTIHYDHSPSVLVPQTTESPSQSENVATQNIATTPTVDNDNDYWEFQDFKGTSDTLTSPTIPQTIEKVEASTSKALNVTYGTQMLQPIKLDPIMPTLNWPDPGHVKETFEDFSEFVSNSLRPDETQELSTVSAIVQSSKESDKPTTTIVNETRKEVAPPNIDSFDDEFDTFQSALPSSKSIDLNVANFNSEVSIKPASVTPESATQSHADFEYAFTKVDNPKSDTISYLNTRPNTLVLNPISTANSVNKHTKTDVALKSLPSSVSSINHNLLQPTPASSSSQQKSTQILQPLSLESYSQINWPNPGIDLQDLSRFNPVETLHSLKSDLSTNSQSKVSSPVHTQKGSVNNQADDDIWGEFVSSKPKQPPQPKKSPAFADDDEWTDFVSSPSVKPQNGLNTISLNVHTNLNIQKSSKQGKFTMKNNQIPIDIPSLNYITPKSSNHKSYNERHFQNL